MWVSGSMGGGKSADKGGIVGEVASIIHRVNSAEIVGEHRITVVLKDIHRLGTDAELDDRQALVCP